MNITMTYMGLCKKSFYESEWHIYENKDEMYLEMCYFTDKIQELIADKVYEKVYKSIISRSTVE